MGILSNHCEVFDVSFGVWVLEEDAGYVPVGEVCFEDVHYFNNKTWKIQTILIKPNRGCWVKQVWRNL